MRPRGSDPYEDSWETPDPLPEASRLEWMVRESLESVSREVSPRDDVSQTLARIARLRSDQVALSEEIVGEWVEAALGVEFKPRSPEMAEALRRAVKPIADSLWRHPRTRERLERIWLRLRSMGEDRSDDGFVSG